MTWGDDSTVSRRTFLRTAGGATVAAATAGVAAAQDDETTTEGDGTPEDGTPEEGDGTPEEGDGTPEDGTETEGGDGRTAEVIVGPDGEFVFEPGTDEPLRIQPDTTVRFVWDSNTHNIVVESQPDEADWEGHEEIEDQGFEYSHTFEVEGTYEYYCEPHRSAGMVGTIEVSEDAGEGGGGGGAAGPQIPDAAKTLGIISASAMASVLALAYFFLKYGGDYGEVEA